MTVKRILAAWLVLLPVGPLVRAQEKKSGLDPPAAAQTKPPRLDAYGDPLPPGALLRIGSLRLQTGGVIGDLTFSRDGKHIVAATRTMGVFVWDVATGKELHHLPPIPPSRFEIEPPPTDRFVGRVLAPGGRYEAEVDRKSVLTLKEVATGREIIESRSRLDEVHARRVQFSPNGKTLAVMRFGVMSHGSIPISLYEVASGKQLPSQAVVRLSPGGTHVAEVSKQGLVRLRAVAGGREVQFDRKPWGVARHVAFAVDGKTLAIMDAATSAVHLYEVATGKLRCSLAFQVKPYSEGAAAHIALDDRTVTLVVGGDGVHWHDLKTGERLVRRGTESERGFGGGTFSPDSKLLASWENPLEILEVATGKRVAIKVKGCGLRFTADGRRLAVLADPYKGVVKVFEAATGRLVQTSTEGGPVDRIALSPDGKYLAGADGGEGMKFGGHGAAVRLWHADTGTPVHHFVNPRADDLTVKFAPDGKTITAISHPRYYYLATSAWVWNAAGGKLLKHVAWDGGNGLPTGTLSADGRVMATTKVDGKLIVTEAVTRKILMQDGAVAHERERMFFSPDARFLLAHCRNHASGHLFFAMHLWDVASGKQLLATEWRDSRYHYGYLDGGGRLLVVVWRPEGENQPTQLTCYDLAIARKLPRGTLTRTVSQNTHIAINYLPMISPNAWLLAEPPKYGGPVEVRELATGQVVGRLLDRGQVIPSSVAHLDCTNDRLAFSPNGRLLAAATTVGTILVWDLATSEMVAELKGHRGAVRSVSWSRDGKRLVSSGQDMTLLVWDAAPWWARVEKPARRLTAQELEALWRDLASDKGKRGSNAVWQLVRAPRQAVTLLRKHLAPAGPRETAPVRALLADLNSARFAVREKAYAELEKLGDLALPALEHALTGSPSIETRRRAEKLLHKLDRTPPTAPAAAWLQQTRALTVLAILATPDAKTMLRDLARGEPEAWRTRAAQAAVRRFE